MNKSVTRRIIAIMVSACGIGTMTYLSLTGGLEALNSLTIIVGMVIAFYFGTQKNV